MTVKVRPQVYLNSKGDVEKEKHLIGFALNQRNILNNLMSNALKFTKDSGVISLKVKQQPNSILFVFADNGIGIPKKQQKHIFKKFSKAGRPGLNGETSVGLGLNIVKTIVKWHKGNIWFESEENKGTTFFIEIPKKQQ